MKMNATTMTAALPSILLAGMLSGCGGGNSQWTWVDVPESKCAAGTATGFGISPHAGSTQLLIYLQGGGSCHDMNSCWTDPRAANTAGYGKAEFLKEPKKKNYLIFKRAPDSGNPFLNANMVFIPYCTGDFHSGYNMHTLTGNGESRDTYFWGGRNMEVFLTKIREQFPQVDQIWLVGTSAGGVGTTANYYKVRDTFATRTDVINDSGTPLGIPSKDEAQELWGTPMLPGCETCTNHLEKVESIRNANPETRYALLSFDYDNIIAKGYGVNLDTFNSALEQTLVNLSGDTNVASFTVGNPKTTPQHVIMGHFSRDELMQPMARWLTHMVNDEPWVSEHLTP